MKMNIKKILKSSLISLAVLGMIGDSISPSTVSAHRRYRTHKQLHRRHTRRNKRTKRYGKLRKYRKHNRTHYVWTNRRKARHYKRRVRKPRKQTRTHTWKLYRKNGSLAGTFHSYKEYKDAKGWLNWFNGYEANSNNSHKYHRGHKHTNNVTNSSNNSESNYQSNTYNNNDQDSSSQTPSNANVAQNLAELKQQTLTDINNDRKENGLAPLTETPELEQLANTRAQQIESDFRHIGGDYNENLTETEQGNTEISDGTPVTNNNGYDMANNEENALMNHDSHSNNGHRRNILNPDSTQIGVGASYDPSDVEGYPYKLVEDFE